MPCHGGRRGQRPSGPMDQAVRRSPMIPVDPLEVLEVGELDHDPAPLRAHVDLHPGVELVGEQLLQLEEPGGPELAPGRPAVGRRHVVGAAAGARPHGLLGVAHGQALAGDAPGQRLLEGPVGRPEQRLGVAGRHLAVGHQPLDLGRQLEQPQEVGDGRAALADPLGHRLLRHVEVLDQLLVGGRFLERVEVVAVEVLHQRVLERQLVADVAHDDRHDTGGRPAWPPATAARRR